MPDLKSELNKLMDTMQFDDDDTIVVDVPPTAPVETKPVITADSPITALDLTVRAVNVLHSYRITTVGQLVAKTKKDLLKLKSFGVKAVKDIEYVLATHQLNLGDTPAKEFNVQQQVWRYVKAHPGCTARDVGIAFDMNFKQPSARLFQLLSRNALTREAQPDGSYRWYAPMDTYPLMPVGHTVKLAQAARRQQAATRQQAVRREKAAAIPPAGTVELAAAPQPATFTADSLLNRLSVLEARRLYDELKKIFGDRNG